MSALMLALWMAVAPGAGAGADAPTHDLHVSYGNAAVEGNVLAVRIRFFRDDLQGALARQTGRAGFRMSAEPEVEAAFPAYVRDHLSVHVGGRTLEPTVVASGEDELDREPVWWYAIQYEAPSPLTAFRMRNTLLTELFDDQTNIVKFVHFPDEQQKTYSFARGEESFEVRF
ncbi:MAG TPA: DUF6702 family protein [Longimicrobiales bacterium]|nr:DUF6702 family protein [Longimicrobiales bacterium]